MVTHRPPQQAWFAPQRVPHAPQLASSFCRLTHSPRLVSRRGRQKALVAVGHRLLTIVYHVLSQGRSYQEPPPTDLDQRRRCRARDRAIAQLRQLGDDVAVTPKQPAA